MTIKIKVTTEGELKDAYVATDIDSSGMSLHFLEHGQSADTFQSEEDAQSFIKRLNERYKGKLEFETVNE